MGSIQGTDYRHDKSKPLPPDCESSEVFTDRTLKWWQDTIVRELNASITAYGSGSATTPTHILPLPAHILAVSHGAYISTLVRALGYTGQVEVPQGFRIGGCWNTSVSEIMVYAAGEERKVFAKLVRWADVSHLIERREGEEGRNEGDKTTEEEEEERVDLVRIVHDEQAGVKEEEREMQARGVSVLA
jgi:probable phosphoglycerate mutase